MKPIDSVAPDVLQTITALRQEIHAHPELGFEVPETAQRVVRHLSDLPGISIRKNVAQHGLVATLNADRPGRCVHIRLRRPHGLPAH